MMKHKPAHAAALAQRFLQPGDVVVELGAADAQYTRIYSKRVGPDGYVLAVEPHKNTARLQKLVAACPWVHLSDCAVSDSSGETLLHTDREHPKCSSLFARNVAARGKCYAVPVTTLDELVQHMPRSPQLIQIDCQGAEAAILRGARRTLRLPIVWIIELWPSGLLHAGASLDDVLGPFAEAGYTPHSVRGKPITWATAHRDASVRHGWSSCDVVLVPRDLMVAAA